jgi:hypothetical protein
MYPNTSAQEGGSGGSEKGGREGVKGGSGGSVRVCGVESWD